MRRLRSWPKPIKPSAARRRTAAESYLNVERALSAARSSGADSIHPGYGFLSENADFAEAVKGSGLIWVGPPASAIRAMGLKDEAKRLMAAAGVPTTPGYQGVDQSELRLRQEADRIGYPILIKAVAGGGGKGMRRVNRPMSSVQRWPLVGSRLQPVLATIASCSRRMCLAPGTSKFKFSGTPSATSSICLSAIAPCRDAIKR